MNSFVKSGPGISCPRHANGRKMYPGWIHQAVGSWSPVCNATMLCERHSGDGVALRMNLGAGARTAQILAQTVES